MESGGWRVEGGGWKVEGEYSAAVILQLSLGLPAHLPPPSTLHPPPTANAPVEAPKGARSKKFSRSEQRIFLLRAPMGSATGSLWRCSGHPSAMLRAPLGDAMDSHRRRDVHAPAPRYDVRPSPQYQSPLYSYSLYTSLALAKVMISRCWLNLSSPLFIAI